MKGTYFHGTDTIALHIGICLTSDEQAAENYAEEKNDGQVYEITFDDTGLDGEEVEYDFDDCEPIIPEGCTADYVTYTDSDMYGRDHDTTMLLTERAVAAATIVGAVEVAA